MAKSLTIGLLLLHPRAEPVIGVEERPQSISESKMVQIKVEVRCFN